MRWRDLRDTEAYVFEDGSVLTEVHDQHLDHCYKFTLKRHPRDIKDPSIVVSEDHYILCDVGKLDKYWRAYISTIQETNIPRVRDIHAVVDENGNIINEYDEIIEYDSYIEDDENNHWWLSAKTIFTLLMSDRKVNPVGNVFKKWDYAGERECFCVSTDKGRYSCCGVVSHNSVALRNIIFHSMTHSDDIVLGLVDLKLSEFSRYKGMANICGVANTVAETAELLRVAREVMYKRNKENAENDLTDFMDFKPQGPTNIIRLFGHEYDENMEFDVKINGEPQKMTAGQMLEFIQNNSD